MAFSGSLPQINLGVQGRALDWFEVLGYRVVEDKATDYAHLKQALSEQFPVAKVRVAPLKDISISRLELLACVWGTRLAASVKNDLNLPDVRIYYLTDSMTALAWIQRTRDWGVFVSNRVKEIRNLSDVSSWEHVPSEKNFVNNLSRCCSAQQLVYLRWWEGPSWLSESPVQCPRSKQVPDEEAVNLELRKSILVNTAKRIEEFNWHLLFFILLKSCSHDCLDISLL
ncbi:integrase catalytic domain-containing protein [Trichonephila clavipes]|uniref:Integrase catalytic domain-containing protein n=1 Tax=Trichonephila clavipes TaxID=2585209 RepID=A0A8X6S201_TRICX|nr:integrase catalytic domain-containing protein [Trichonephila clavipes]